MTSGKSDLVEVEAGLRDETEKAFCLSRDGSESIWIPKSQCEIERGKNNCHTFTMPEWLANDKGLI